jgi:hypothetical protein
VQGRAVFKKSYDSVRGNSYLISHLVWYRCEAIMFGRIVIKCNCITVRIEKCLCAVRLFVFGVKQKDASSLFALNSAAVYAIREATGNRRV